VQDSIVQIQDTVAVAETVTYHPKYTQRSFKADFKSNYKDEKFNYKEPIEDKSMWDNFWEWVNELFDGIFGKNQRPDVNGNWMDAVIKALAIVVILVVVYFITRAILHKESYWIFGRSRKGIAVQDADAENILVMDLEQLIQQTKTAGDYRLAVRYYYLSLLKKLSFREIITWHWDKTNTDYLYEIKDSTLRKDFEYLSYVYDHSWYGDFPVDEKAFAKAERAFLKTINTL
jgi:hypothetical protein